jgi:hypothetical protein
VSTKVTKPEQCFVGCCYPLDRSAFIESWNMEQERDFLRSQLGTYQGYNKEALWKDIYGEWTNIINSALDKMSEAGSRVKRQFGLDDLTSIESSDVFILLAHNSKGRELVELYDGLFTYEAFTKAIPGNFKGMMDLSLCNSDVIRNELKKRFSNQIISFKVELPIIQHVLFTKQVIINLQRFDVNYLDCYTTTIHHLLN